jgi:hypothetical protein
MIDRMDHLGRSLLGGLTYFTASGWAHFTMNEQSFDESFKILVEIPYLFFRFCVSGLLLKLPPIKLKSFIEGLLIHDQIHRQYTPFQLPIPELRILTLPYQLILLFQ